MGTGDWDWGSGDSSCPGRTGCERLLLLGKGWACCYGFVIAARCWRRGVDLPGARLMRATTGGANAGLHRSGVRRGRRIVTRDCHELQRLWRLDGDYHARNIDAERRGNDAGRRWRRDLDGDGCRGERVDSADLREGHEVRYGQAQR